MQFDPINVSVHPNKLLQAPLTSNWYQSGCNWRCGIQKLDFERRVNEPMGNA